LVAGIAGGTGKAASTEHTPLRQYASTDSPLAGNRRGRCLGIDHIHR